MILLSILVGIAAGVGTFFLVVYTDETLKVKKEKLLEKETVRTYKELKEKQREGKLYEFEDK